MTPPPTHADPAGAAYLRLRAAANDQGRQTDELLVLYTLEAFLRRLATTEHAERLVLKGGVLLAAFGDRRPTRDIDVQARQMDNDVKAVTSLIQEIAATPATDEVIFDVAAATAEAIREDDGYQGVRVRMPARLAAAKTTFAVDVTVGDPIHPAPQRIELPSLLEGDPPVSMLGYPLSMVLAEKLATALQRGTVNTRWRDFADIWTIRRNHSCDGAQLQAALGAVATYRALQLQPLLRALEGYPAIAQARWISWLRRHKPPTPPPDEFDVVLADISRFADPALLGLVGDHTWQPATSAWVGSDGKALEYPVDAT